LSRSTAWRSRLADIRPRNENIVTGWHEHLLLWVVTRMDNASAIVYCMASAKI
jgi:hypothetical protein